MRLRLIGLLGLLALVVASCGATPPQASGPNEGIQVHGDWTIDIYNVDGSHDEHIAFSNDLYPSGATALRDILARSLVPVNWAVWARGEPTSGNPCLAGTNPTVCVMEEATGDLQVSTDGASLVLDGAFTAERDGNVGFVSTHLGTCPPDSCEFPNPLYFTGTPVANEDGVSVNVDEGQTVQVHVEISFT